MPEKTRAALGGCKRFECRVIGFPRPTIQWFKDGRNITKNDRYEFDYSVDGVITMVIKNVTDKDQGVYSCRAENSEGWAATAAFLNVRIIQSQIEEELTSVHQMKFEIGGTKDKNGIEIDGTEKDLLETRYNDFIETFGEKMNGKREIRFNEKDDLDGVRSLDSEIHNDSGIGHDDGSLTMSIATDVSAQDINGHSAPKIRTDVGVSNKERHMSFESDQSTNEDTSSGPLSSGTSKRRLSDLDVYLRMMNDKVSSYLSDIPDEDSEGGSRKHDSKSQRDEAKKEPVPKERVEPVEEKMTSKNEPKQESVDITKDSTHQKLEEKSVDKKELEQEIEQTQEEVVVEERDTLDEISEFLKLGRKKSRRSTHDSGFGDDDFREYSSESDGEGNDNADRKRHFSKEEIIEKNKKQKQKHQLKQQMEKEKGKGAKTGAAARPLIIPNICFEEAEEEAQEEECSTIEGSTGDVEKNSGRYQNENEASKRSEFPLNTKTNETDGANETIHSEKQGREVYPEEKDKTYFHVDEITDFGQKGLDHEPEFYLSSDKKREEEFPMKVEVREGMIQNELVSAQEMSPKESQYQVETDICQSTDQTTEIKSDSSITESEGRRLRPSSDADVQNQDDGNNNEGSLVSAMSLLKKQQQSNVEEEREPEITETEDLKKTKISDNRDKNQDNITEKDSSKTIDITSELQASKTETEAEKQKLSENDDGSLPETKLEGEKVFDNKRKKKTLGDVVAESFNDETEADFQTAENMRNGGKGDDQETEERLKQLGQTYRINDIKEGSISESDNEFRSRKDSDRKSTLKKRHFLVESDDDDDETRSRSVNDDDYFASTESLGMGVSRESLDKTFSQFDLFRGEGISEKEEYLSRSCSKDSENKEETDGADLNEYPATKTLNPMDLMKYSEYSDDDSSDIISSEPENMDKLLAENAQKITIEISSLSQAWSDEEPYEENTTTSDVKEIPDTLPVVPNEIPIKNAKDDVLVLQARASLTEEIGGEKENLNELREKATDKVKVKKSNDVLLEQADKNDAEKNYVDESTNSLKDKTGKEKEKIEELSKEATDKTGKEKEKIEELSKEATDKAKEEKIAEIPLKKANKMDAEKNYVDGTNNLTDKIGKEKEKLDDIRKMATDKAKGEKSDGVPLTKAEKIDAEKTYVDESASTSQDSKDTLTGKEEKEPETGRLTSEPDITKNIKVEDRKSANVPQQNEKPESVGPTKAEVPSKAEESTTESNNLNTKSEKEPQASLSDRIQEDIVPESVSKVQMEQPAEKTPKILKIDEDDDKHIAEVSKNDVKVEDDVTSAIPKYKSNDNSSNQEKLMATDANIQNEATKQTNIDTPESMLQFESEINNIEGGKPGRDEVDMKFAASTEEKPIKKPKILRATADVTVSEGKGLVLEWEISGHPTPKVQLYKDGAPVQFCEGDGIFQEEEFVTMEILDTVPEDSGCYELHIYNESGNDISMVNVMVKETSLSKQLALGRADSETEEIRPPEFCVVPRNVTLHQGQTVVIKASVTGSPQPKIEWLHNGKVVENSEDIDIIEETSYCCLVIPNPDPVHVGEYLCRATNECGIAEAQFSVRMEGVKEEYPPIQEDVIEKTTKIPDQGKVPDTHVKDEGSKQGAKAKQKMPTSPTVQLEVSESDETLSKKFRATSPYCDNKNNVILETGDVVELLNKPVPSHWLVRKESDKNQVCYAPAALLVPTGDSETNTDKKSKVKGQHKQPIKTDKESQAKAQEKNRKLLHDLVESEADYLCDLKDLYENYFEPAQEKEFPEQFVNRSADIFSNVMDLYKFHHENFLPELMDCEDPEKIGSIFLEKRDSFTEYLPFCAGRKKSSQCLESEEMQKFLRDYSKSIGDPEFALDELLSRPGERIHEYIDLLKNLIKYTSAAGGDTQSLMSAVQMLSDLCREVENFALLDNMEGYDGDVKKLGPVVRHDKVILWKDEDDSGEEHHIFLFPDKLMVAKAMDSKEDKDSPKLEFNQMIELKDVDFYDDDDALEDTRTIELWDTKEDANTLSQTPTLTLQTLNPYAKRALVRDIQEAQTTLGVVKSTKDKMPEHRKIAAKTQKVKPTTPKRAETQGGQLDNESDRSSDDFKLLDTASDAGSYMTPEFEDGTTRPIFRKKLQKTVVAENAMVRMECIAVGIPHPKVLWLKNNRPLKSTDKCIVKADGAKHALEFPEARRDDTGLYTARAMNVNGSTISTAELLVGNAQPAMLKKYKEGLADSEFQSPAYFFQMNNCQVEEGRLARFDCRVVAYPKPEIIWMKDGKVVEPGDRYKLLNFNDEIYSLLVQNVETDDTGRYTCWAHNKYGEAMTEAYLNVIALEEQIEDADIAPKFLTKFYDQTITDGVPVEFQCLIAGKPEPVVTWLMDDLEIMPTDNILISHADNLCSLRIKEAKIKNSGNYSCYIKNPLGEAVCSAGLTVLDKNIKGVPMLPKFLKRISDQSAHAGEGLVYEVVVVGEPRPKVTWMYNHKPISETHRRFQSSYEGDTYMLSMTELRTEDQGKITCKAVNSEGEVYCSSDLTVKRPPPEPVEERPGFKQKDFDAKYGYSPTFIKKIEDVYAPNGKSAKFECRVMGIPEPSVTWQKDGKPISPGNRYWINRDSGNCTLTIRDVAPSDTGTYSCTIANAAGETSCLAHLKMDDARDREVAFDKDHPAFARRLSKDSTKSDSAPTLPYDKPTLTDIREESVRLSWSPVYTSSLPQDAKNVKYVIEARELPGFDWNKVATGIHGNTHLVKNLKPDREYAFRVRAENQYGSSDATQPSMLSRQKPVEDDLMEKLHVKLPEYRSPPKLPQTKPVVTDMGQENIRLAWKPAAAPVAAKKAAPISYRIEAQELPATDWLPVATRLRDTSYYLPELHSDRDYNIRIRAENKYGLSDPSESIWIPKATSFPGVPVRRPEIVEIEPQAVRVQWQRVEVPAFHLDEQPLTYMLEMQEPPMRDWREVARDLRDTSYTVKGLKPSQDYRFRVRAKSPDGKIGEPSPATSLYRTFATTRSPIDRLELEDYEPDFEGVRLAWNRVDIPPYHNDEEPLRYMIEMNEPPLDEWRPLVSGLPTTRYRVTDLVPDRDYKFRIRALTPYGISPPSHTLPVSYRRPLPAPSRPIPQTTRLEYDDSDFLTLSWKPPVVETKRPIKYQVQMQTPPMTDWRPLVSGIPDTSYRIRGLGPSRDYMFRVVPETSLGPLQALPPVSLTSLPAPKTTLPGRPDILDLQPDSLRLSWRRPIVDTFKPLSYRIDVQEPPSLDWRPIATGIMDTNYHVTGLRPNRDYIFRVTPTTTTGSLEPLPYATLTSMPVRPRLYTQEPKATDVGKDSVKLTWRPAEMPYFAFKHTPIRYLIEMRTMPSSDWIPVARNVPDTSYIVKGLRPENDYQFRIKAQTDFGCSEPTLPVTVYRKPVPLFPRREPTVTSIAPDSVVLSWQPADIPSNVSHMPFVSYRIEVQDPPGIGNWKTLISNIPKTSYHVTGLRPDRDYLFRVRSQAESIITEPTLPVYLSRRAGPPRMPPEQPYIFEVHPESVKLQWRSVELPPRITDYSPVTYRLEMQELPRADWVTLARGIPHTDFHVTNLNPDREYNFRIRAENDMGMSDPTPVVSLKKRATAPTIPQEEPLIYDVSPNGSFRLSWRSADVPMYLSDGSPVTYTIFVQEPPSSTWRPLVRRIPHTSYHVTNLQPDRDYNFRIQAENEFGVSRPTLPVRLIRVSDWRTPIDLPEITDIDDSTRSLSLRWRKRSVAPFDKGPLRYHIESWEPKQRSWNKLATGISDTSYRVTGLPLDQDYLFRIRAEAERALSEPTYPVSLSRFKVSPRLPVPRPQLYDVEPESVRLSWQPLQLPRYEPKMLPRKYRLELRELPSRDWKPVASDIPDTSYRVTGLRPRQDYEFRVRGLGDDGPTDYTHSVPLYRRPVIPRIPLEGPRISEVRDDSVDLNWTLVDVPSFGYDEKPLAFLIEAQTPPRYDWTPVARNVSGDRYRVTGLQRNQDYVFRIRAQYPTGLSEPSPYIPVYRRPSESQISKNYQLSSRTNVTSSDAPNVTSTQKLAAPSDHALASVTNKVNSNIKSKRDYFLAEMQRLDKKQFDISKRVQKYKINIAKPAQTTTKSLKEKFSVEARQTVTGRPPASPRSRRDKFLAEKTVAASKIQPLEKKVDFGKALDKFRDFEIKRPFRPVEYRRDYSQSRESSLEPVIIRKPSLDFRQKSLPPLSSIPKPLFDPTPLPRPSSTFIYTPLPKPKTFSSPDDSSLIHRSLYSSATDLSFKKRHLVPDRFKYGQTSTKYSSLEQSRPSYSKLPPSYTTSSSSFTPSHSTSYRKSVDRFSSPSLTRVGTSSSSYRSGYVRPHSWSGDITSRRSSYTPSTSKYTDHGPRNRSYSVSSQKPREYRHSSLSLIGQSIYHDLSSHAKSYSKLDLTSHSRPDSSYSRSYLPSSNLGRAPSLPNLNFSERGAYSSTRPSYSGREGSSSYSMERDTSSFQRSTRSGSFSSDRIGRSFRGGSVLSTSLPPRDSRSPSKFTTRSPSVATTAFDSSFFSRSGSIAESGYLSKSRTPSFPLNVYMPKPRSSSVAQDKISTSVSRSGSALETGNVPKRRSASAIITGLPPIQRTSSPSSKRKDVSFSYTSYLPPTKQSLTQKLKEKLSGSRDSLLSTDSTPSHTSERGKSSTPTRVTDSTPTRHRTSSTGSTGSQKDRLTRVHEKSREKLLETTSESKVSNTQGPKVLGPQIPLNEPEKPKWLKTPASFSVKNIA